MINTEDRRTIGTNVSKAILSAGVSQDSIAEAIGLSSSELQFCIEQDRLTVPQLSQVGGLLGVPAAMFLKDVA